MGVGKLFMVRVE